ncbi:hypothetical protein L6164_003054 [Bauhinia variegata]|uniref:Uncharacterized protein n=1 Tax=Bauhinia variegata TaxID=167791 RepID=A0ACB9Q047_BAUVA|nr:hypothetical protein L6164_003054 [Bauhinia variegata]
MSGKANCFSKKFNLRRLSDFFFSFREIDAGEVDLLLSSETAFGDEGVASFGSSLASVRVGSFTASDLVPDEEAFFLTTLWRRNSSSSAAVISDISGGNTNGSLGELTVLCFEESSDSLVGIC